jgi:hypothetical protein
MSLPYIPPFSRIDHGEPPCSELVILFIEAVARVTDAFKELRDSILPLYARAETIRDARRRYPLATHEKPQHPIDEAHAWAKRWKLEFENNELDERVFAWAFFVLDAWHRNAESRDSLRVDCGWWDRSPKVKMSADRPGVPALLSQWNPDREDFGPYATGMRARFEKFLQGEKRRVEQELERFDMRPYRKRERKRPPGWDFEWVALHRCRGFSDAKIAQQKTRYPGVSREVVKKARQALERDLKILPLGN